MQPKLSVEIVTHVSNIKTSVSTKVTPFLCTMVILHTYLTENFPMECVYPPSIKEIRSPWSSFVMTHT